MAEPRVLKLVSPAYGDPIYYKWPLVITKKHDEAAEIVDTIRLVCEDFPELKYAVENVMLKDYEATDFDSMNQLCQRYNKAIRNILSLWKGRAPPPRMFKPPNKELLRHIINLCYSHAIKEPEKLNLYEPFSPEVYGETSFDMVARILEEVQSSKDECFVDLGSGVGQVVLQAAASNQFKECFGVEKAETPAAYAKEMENEFKRWMDWFGKIYTEFSLEKGDFLEDKWKDIINDCGVVFVNNFAFGPVVNHHLKSRFQTMKEGSKVISSREFCPTNFKFNKRNLSELGAMMRVTEIKTRSEEASVSWTGNTVSYYLHTVDRTRLEKYFSILKKKKEGQELDDDELSLYSESNYSLDTTGTPVDVETLEDNLDDLYLGTTTRHQWQLLTDTIQQSKQDAKDATKIEISPQKKGRQKLAQRPAAMKKSGKLDLKNKILRKYGQQAIKKARQAKKDEEDEENNNNESEDVNVTSDSGSDEEFQVKTVKKKRGRPAKVQDEKKSALKMPNNKKCVLDQSKLEKDLDKFLLTQKAKYLEFINRMNTKEYAKRLKVMIECESAKSKLLQREINETERVVQNLISDGLKNFTSRLDELEVAVKTPLELLSKSSALAEKRQDLENKVTNMEVEIYNLEERHKNLCAARDKKNRSHGLEPLIESEDEEIAANGESSKAQLTAKLCGAILGALNQRRSLIDKETSLSGQISILEKISSTKSTDADVSSGHTVEPEVTRVKENTKPKPKPVAFVPPRMLSHDKKNTLSPETTVPPEIDQGNGSLPSSQPPQRRPRGRPRKKPKSSDELRASSTQSDSSQDSKMDVDDERPPLANPPRRRTPLNDLHNSADRQFGTYFAQEERAPVIFPPANSKHNEGFTKEFLKTSSKLLNSTPQEWQAVEKLWQPLSTDKSSTTLINSHQNGDVYDRKSRPDLPPAALPKKPIMKKELNSPSSSNNNFTYPTSPPTLFTPYALPVITSEAKAELKDSNYLDATLSSRHNIYDNLQFAYLRQLRDEQKTDLGPVLDHLSPEKNCNRSEQQAVSAAVSFVKPEVPDTPPPVYMARQSTVSTGFPDDIRHHMLPPSTAVSLSNQYDISSRSYLMQSRPLGSTATLKSDADRKPKKGRAKKEAKSKQKMYQHAFDNGPPVLTKESAQSRQMLTCSTQGRLIDQHASKKNVCANPDVDAHFKTSFDKLRSQQCPYKYFEIPASTSNSIVGENVSSRGVSQHKTDAIHPGALAAATSMQHLSMPASSHAQYVMQQMQSPGKKEKAMNNAKEKEGKHRGQFSFPSQIAKEPNVVALLSDRSPQRETVLRTKSDLLPEQAKTESSVKQEFTASNYASLIHKNIPPGHHQPAIVHKNMPPGHHQPAIVHKNMPPGHHQPAIVHLNLTTNKSQSAAAVQSLYCPNTLKLLKQPSQSIIETKSVPTSSLANTLPQFPSSVSAMLHSSTGMQSKATDAVSSDPKYVLHSTSKLQLAPSGLLLGQIAGMKRLAPTLPGGYPTILVSQSQSSSVTNATKTQAASHQFTQHTYVPLTQSVTTSAPVDNHPPAKKPRGRKPKKPEVAILSAADKPTHDRQIIASHSDVAPASAQPYQWGSETSGTILRPASTHPVIFSQMPLYDSKGAMKPQLMNVMTTPSSGLGGIIIPKVLTPASTASSQPVITQPDRSRLVLIPVSLSGVAAKGNSKPTYERQQSVTSPTFPPQPSTQ